MEQLGRGSSHQRLVKRCLEAAESDRQRVSHAITTIRYSQLSLQTEGQISQLLLLFLTVREFLLKMREVVP